MDKLVARQRLVMTFTFFSMFFGAGNLIDNARDFAHFGLGLR